MKKGYILLLAITGIFAAFYFVGSGDDVAQYGEADGKGNNPSVKKNDVVEPLQQKAKIDPANLRDVFERSGDLYILARTHFNSSDPESLWLVSKIVSYCAPYGMDPKGYAAQTQSILSMLGSEIQRKTVQGARQKMMERCKGFDGEDSQATFKPNADLVLKTRAARAGSLAAEAALFSSNAPLKRDAEYLKGLINRVIASRDPDAFLAMSYAMGSSASGKEDIYGKNSGSNVAQYAWQLSACRLGMDCTAQGALMTSYCTAAGYCTNESNFEGLVFNHLVKRAEERYVREIMDDIVESRDQ